MSKQHHDQELSPEERKRFESLTRHRMPPPQLEEHIMSELQERGLVEPARGAWNWITKIAAVITLLVLGGSAGYIAGISGRDTVAPPPKNPLYVLLIRESPSTMGGTNLVAEYSQWAAGVYKSGRYITGEKLRDTGRILRKIGAASSPEDGEQILKKIDEPIAVRESKLNEGELGGYFIIEAKDYDEAVQIASQCPHLKYGGTIEVREIEPT